MRKDLNLRKLTMLLLIVILTFPFSSAYSFEPQETPRILVFSETAGYRHSSIEVGTMAIFQLARENDFKVVATENSSVFNIDSLMNYSTVVFLNTSGNVLTASQKSAFEQYIQAGGGFVGVHGAAASEYDWTWYGRLLGSYFTNHPEIQEAQLIKVNKNHISTSHLPDKWFHIDEWYNFTKLPEDINVLVTIDENSYKGGNYGEGHPIAWYHEFQSGRSFYTAMGHREENYSDPLFLKHLLGGILYTIGGDNKMIH